MNGVIADAIKEPGIMTVLVGPKPNDKCPWRRQRQKDTEGGCREARGRDPWGHRHQGQRGQKAPPRDLPEEWPGRCLDLELPAPRPCSVVLKRQPFRLPREKLWKEVSCPVPLTDLSSPPRTADCPSPFPHFFLPFIFNAP